MSNLSRINTSHLARWWRSIDRVTLICVGILIGFGYILMLAASPAVAVRIGASRDMFIFKQVVFLVLAAVIVCTTSLLSLRGVRMVGWIGFVLALGATFLTWCMASRSRARDDGSRCP